jgi:hypothetical protein
MFSDPVYEETPIITHRLYVVRDGNVSLMPRSALTGHGIGNTNAVQLYLSGDVDKFEHILRNWITSTENQSVDSIRLVRVNFIKPTWGNRSYKQDEVMVYEYKNIR